jgi:hypothetical protein
MVRTATGQSPSRPFLTVANAGPGASTVTGTEVWNLVVTRPARPRPRLRASMCTRPGWRGARTTFEPVEKVVDVPGMRDAGLPRKVVYPLQRTRNEDQSTAVVTPSTRVT